MCWAVPLGFGSARAFENSDTRTSRMAGMVFCIGRLWESSEPRWLEVDLGPFLLRQHELSIHLSHLWRSNSLRLQRVEVKRDFATLKCVQFAHERHVQTPFRQLKREPPLPVSEEEMAALIQMELCTRVASLPFHWNNPAVTQRKIADPARRFGARWPWTCLSAAPHP